MPELPTTTVLPLDANFFRGREVAWGRLKIRKNFFCCTGVSPAAIAQKYKTEQELLEASDIARVYLVSSRKSLQFGSYRVRSLQHLGRTLLVKRRVRFFIFFLRVALFAA